MASLSRTISPLLVTALALLSQVPSVLAWDAGNSTQTGPPAPAFQSPDSYLDAVRAQRHALMDRHMREAQEAADARRDAVQEQIDQRRRAFDEMTEQHREQMDRMRRDRMLQHYYPYVPDYYGWGNPWSYFDNPAPSVP